MNAHHDNAPLYRRFVDLLHRTIGLDAASLGHSAIERAIDQRAAAWCEDGHAGATLADYWDAAQASPSMVQALVETVVVPETWFYRDADAFRALARLAHQRLDERGTALPLRILSLPCSTGEEPYTIAMTLLDAGIDAAHMRIDAMDISERSLALAQRAVYSRNSFRGNAFPFRDIHFTRTEDGWRLAPRIAEIVRFSRANLMQLDATALGVYDFVFCRNVLIYFDRDAQQKALHALNNVLVENGTLFVGPAETGLLMRYGMQSAKIPLAFAFHRATPAEAQLNGWHTAPLAWPDPVARTPFNGGLAQTPFSGMSPHTPSAGNSQRLPLDGISRHTSLNGISQNIRSNDSSQRTPLNGFPQHTPKTSSAASQSHEFMSPHVTSPTNAARDTLQAAHALADAGRLTEAANAINVYLEQHAPHAEAFYLLGVLADAGGDTNLARGQYRKALYLDPQHGEALAHLATLLELEGDRNGARLLMERASRAQGAQRG
ncbi:CheR family methyltransferase [Paraburkholderia sediminicola]|uniref:CheR family methyltransferase n=1 Tax=Paraburkholderia sediminicola TaxID=458836 RepID=UPI0038BDAB81